LDRRTLPPLGTPLLGGIMPPLLDRMTSSFYWSGCQANSSSLPAPSHSRAGHPSQTECIIESPGLDTPLPQSAFTLIRKCSFQVVPGIFRYPAFNLKLTPGDCLFRNPSMRIDICFCRNPSVAFLYSISLVPIRFPRTPWARYA